VVPIEGANDFFETLAEKVEVLGRYDRSHPQSAELAVSSLNRYESALEVLAALFVHGCYRGKEGHRPVWETSLQRIANARKGNSGSTAWLNLLHYPALLLFYAGGIAAVAGEKFQNLLSLMQNTTVWHRKATEGSSALISVSNCGSVRKA
jgi:hypothetical protein